jgi:[ribosomal protein S5]-alanine N-acetyltransferase
MTGTQPNEGVLVSEPIVRPPSSGDESRHDVARLVASASEPLRAPGLVLEPLRADHAHELYPDLRAPDLYAYLPEGPPTSLEALEHCYRGWSRRQSSSGDEIWYNYALRVDGEGYVGLLQSTRRSTGEALIAYQIFPRHWRRGFAAAGCRVLFERLWRDGASKLIAHLDARNVASCRLVEALGFVQTARVNGADTFNGTGIDELVYELLRPATPSS